MFKLKYNILVLAQVFLNAVNAFLLIKVFGVSPQTDAYFMLLTIFAAVYMLQSMPVEQFMYFYNDAKVQSRESAERFYHFSLFVSFLTGVFFVALFTLFEPAIIKLFAYKLDARRLELLAGFISLYKWVLLFIPANYICSSLLTAEMKIGYPYLISIIPVFFTVIAQALCYFYGYNEISPLVYAGLFGIILGTFLNFVLVKVNFGYRLSFAFSHQLAPKYLKNSFMMKLGHNVHNFFFPLVTNNFLSAFPAGFVSYFYYAQKIAGVLQSVITGPSIRILQSKISLACSSNDMSSVKSDIKYYFRVFSAVFLAGAAATYFLIPVAIGVISSGKLIAEDAYQIQALFLLLTAWNLIVFIETPFDMLLISMKNSGIFLAVNSFCIANYSLLLLLFMDSWGIKAVGWALMLSQGVNLFFYSKKALKLLDSGQKKVLEGFLLYLKTKAEVVYSGIFG